VAYPSAFDRDHLDRRWLFKLIAAQQLQVIRKTVDFGGKNMHRTVACRRNRPETLPLRQAESAGIPEVRTRFPHRHQIVDNSSPPE
jgi:hypothetical protein